MLSRLQLTAVIFCLTFFTIGSALAQKTGIGVNVIGVDGQPAPNADIKIERQDKKSEMIMAKTDTRGHLAANLEVGTYRLTATTSVTTSGKKFRIQESQVIQTQSQKPSVVAFDMRKPSASTFSVKRTVWVPAQTGTLLGGAWVPVDDKGQFTGASNVETYNGAPTERLQHAPTNTMGTGR